MKAIFEMSAKNCDYGRKMKNNLGSTGRLEKTFD